MQRLLETFAKDVEQLLSDVAIVGDSSIRSAKQSALLFLHVKSIKTAGAINALLQERRWEDALILLRSLLENFISYRWLTLKGDAAVVRFARFECVAKLRQHFKSRKSTVFKRDPEEFDYLAEQAMIEQELMRFNDLLKTLEPTFDLERQKDLDERGLWSGHSIHEMAKQLNGGNSLREVTWTYDIPFSVGSEFAHPNPVVIPSYLTITDGRLTPSFKSNEGWEHEIDILACQTLFQMARFADEDFQLGKSELVQELQVNLERFLQRKDISNNDSTKLRAEQ